MINMKKRNEDEIDEVPCGEKEVHREGNTVFFYEELTPATLYIMKKHLRDILKEGIADHVNIVIDSEGGVPCAIYDFLRAYPLKKYGYVEGMCNSAATLILMGCDERYMTNSSLLLIHSFQGPGEDYEKEGSQRDNYLNTIKQNEILRNIYRERTKIPQKTLDGFLSDRERYLNAQECFEWKIIDGISVFVGE